MIFSSSGIGLESEICSFSVEEVSDWVIDAGWRQERKTYPGAPAASGNFQHITAVSAESLVTVTFRGPDQIQQQQAPNIRKNAQKQPPHFYQ